MSQRPAIRADGVGKRYQLGSGRALSNSLRETLAGAFAGAARRARVDGANPGAGARGARAADTFWALRDVTFEAARGEVLGVIGRNGAGKSTLLKILSRITDPTSGRIVMRGRVGTLLEVGSGFHPELTGRENVYLNATILGMRKREVDRQFDAIIDFAEVERFVDTPVKRYSSGMYVRLAFAVAAHLQTEILIVDEVLAVGDAAFQRKCLGKMEDVAHEGRTVLFVSHNMTAARGLCTRGLLLDHGRVVLDASIDAVVQRYLSDSERGAADGTGYRRHRGTDVAVERVDLVVNGSPASAIQSGDECTFRVHYRALTSRAVGSELSVSVMCFAEGQKLVNLWTNYGGGRGIAIARTGVIECTVPRWPFRSHLMRIDIFTHTGPVLQDWIEEALVFRSHDGDYFGSGVITNPDQGIMFLDHEWRAHAAE